MFAFVLHHLSCLLAPCNSWFLAFPLAYSPLLPIVAPLFPLFPPSPPSAAWGAYNIPLGQQQQQSNMEVDESAGGLLKHLHQEVEEGGEGDRMGTLMRLQHGRPLLSVERLPR